MSPLFLLVYQEMYSTHCLVPHMPRHGLASDLGYWGGGEPGIRIGTAPRLHSTPRPGLYDYIHHDFYGLYSNLSVLT
jgi:hypothetical protein